MSQKIERKFTKPCTISNYLKCSICFEVFLDPIKLSCGYFIHYKVTRFAKAVKFQMKPNLNVPYVDKKYVNSTQVLIELPQTW